MAGKMLKEYPELEGVELWSAFAVASQRDICRSGNVGDSSLTADKWYIPGSDVCASDTPLRGRSFPSSGLDSSVLKILDEQLDAIIGKESEETIAATLETIIEIVSPSSTAPSQLQNHDEYANIPHASSSTVPLPATKSSSTHIHYLTSTLQDHIPNNFAQSQIISPTNQFFKLDDFADDDILPISTSHCTSHDYLRPRSSDSTSTAPLTPFGSPQTPSKLLEEKRSPIDPTPLKGRVERMMSCAAARGSGQCNCGLGDWFHHTRS
jgi:hypothetical protein